MKYLRLFFYICLIIFSFSCSKKTTESDHTTVKKPVFLLASGTYPEGQYIAIRCDTEEAEIHYTLDNSEPVLSSPVYSQEMRIPDFFINNSNTCIIKARAFKTGFLPSAIASATYSVYYESSVAAPVISPLAQSYNYAPITVNLICPTPNAQIRYTTDGSEPNYYSTLYNTSIQITSPKTVKVKAFKAGMNASPITSHSFNPLIYELGSCLTPHHAVDVVLKGTYAYVAGGEAGIRIIDVSNSAQPIEAGSIALTGYTYSVTIQGDYLFATSWSGLSIYNISNPVLPELTGTYQQSSYSANDVFVVGNYAYLSIPQTGFRIVDISDPTTPTMVGHMTLSFPYSVSVQGNYAYLTSLSGLHIINITNPASPSQIGFYNTSGLAMDAMVMDGLAYISVATFGLRIVNISNPYNPQPVSNYTTPGGAGGIYVNNNIAYLSAFNSGLRLIDVANPTEPVLLGTYYTPNSAQKAAVSGNLIYVAAGEAGLRILYNTISK